MKKLYSIIILAVSLLVTSSAWSQGSVTATYSTGDISTDKSFTSIPGTSTCPGLLDVVIPAGNIVASVDVSYDMTAGGGAWMSEQKSWLYCSTTSNGEATISSGSGYSGGTVNYSRTGLGIADGASGPVSFEMHAGRSWGGSGCSTVYNKVVDGTWTITVNYILIPSCLFPSALTTSGETTTTVDLAWTAGDSETLWDIELVDVTASGSATGTPTTEDVTTNPYTLSGLTAQNNYQVYLRADCGGDTSDWIGPVSFTTACPSSFSLPFSEGMDNSGSTPGCWTQSGVEDWKFSSLATGNHIGSNGTINGSSSSEGYFAWVDASGTQADAILTSPAIDVSLLTTPMLSFYELSDNEGGSNSLLTVDVYDGAAWNTVGTYNSNTVGDAWEKKDIILDGLTFTGDAQVRFTFTEPVSSAYVDDIAIDDVSFAEAPSCQNPSVTISNITTSGATATWAAATGATSYDWEVVPSGNAQGVGVIASGSGETGLTVSFTGLTASGGDTPYDFLISSDCTADYVTIPFRTICDVVTTFPWSEDFSDGGYTSGNNFLPNCFTAIDNNSDGDLLRGWSDVGTDGAWGVMIYTDYNFGSNDDYLVLPQFSLPANMTLSYSVKVQSPGEPNDYKVLLSTTGKDPADFTEELLPLTVVTNSTYATQTIDLSAYSGDVFIAIHIPPGGLDGWKLFFDEFQVFETPVAPLCAVNLSPADGETDVVLNGSAVNLSWEANPLGETPTGYKVYYGSDPSSISLAGETTNTSVNMTSDGNLPGATMYYKIIPTNNGVDATGCDVIEFEFASLLGSTCDDPITVSSLPYSETAATTVGFYDNYTGSPGTGCTTSSYLNGNDIVYAYTATANTYVTIDLTNITDTYTGVFIYENCSDIGSTCVAGDTNGFSTDDLKIENFAMVGGSTYYIVMSTYASPQTTTFDLSIKESVNWTGTTSSDWADVSNWSTGAVAYKSSDIVAIDGTFTNEPSISSTDAVAKTVIVTTGNTLTIDETSSLTVSGDFTNTGTVTLNSTADDYSSLIVTGTATGDIVYNRYVNVYDDTLGGGWDLVCSPVGMSIADFITANGSNIQVLGDDYAFSQFNNATGQWERYATALQTGNFEAGKGYSMATTGGSTVAFTGAMQTADQSINIINNNGLNGVGRRWNLVSNPFPSYINGNAAAGTNNFMDANSAVIDSEFLAVYGWNGSSYTIYNNLTGTDTDTPAFSIAPGQGFWVAAASESEVALNFTAAMRTTTGTGDFVSGPQLLTYNVAVKLYNGEIEKAATNFYFRDGLSLDIDPGYDAAAFNQSMALSTRLPQGSQETAFGINAMGMDAMQNTRVPLEIRQNAGQAFRVSIADMELPEDIYVYLEDTLNGTLTSLKDGDFELVAQSNLSGSDRFFIVFKSNSVLSNGDTLGINALNVYKANTDSFVTIAGISPELGKLNVSLYNILGQTVREKALSSATATQRVSTQGLASGLYIVQIRSGNQTTVKKIIVK